MRRLLAALHAGNIEDGVLVYEGSRTSGHLLVPPSSVAAARRLLVSPPWAGVLVLPP